MFINFYKNLFSSMLFSQVDDGGGGGDGGNTTSWTENIEDEGLKESLSQFENQEALFKSIGYEPPKAEEPGDWRADIPEELKKTADKFSSADEAIRAIENFRKRESQIRVPGKDASEEDVAKYRKATGIPDKAEDYEFPEVEEVTDELKASRTEWGKRFHDMGITKDQAKLLSQLVNDDGEKIMAAQVEADKAFAKTQEETLRDEWKGDDYEKNKTFANRAFSEIANRAGLSLEDLTKIETKDGRFLMDRAEMLKLFSVIGREMSEGTLGPAISESERDTVEEEIAGIRKQIAEAQSEGNSKLSNRRYQTEQKLLERMGNQPVVGAQGRQV